MVRALLYCHTRTEYVAAGSTDRVVADSTIRTTFTTVVVREARHQNGSLACKMDTGRKGTHRFNWLFDNT